MFFVVIMIYTGGLEEVKSREKIGSGGKEREGGRKGKGEWKDGGKKRKGERKGKKVEKWRRKKIKGGRTHTD